MRHRHCGRCAMPMLQTGRDHISRPNFLTRPAVAPDPAEARRDNQSLPERTRVPCGAGTPLECDTAATNTCRIGRLEQRVDADRAGEVFRRSLAGRLRTVSCDLHHSIPALSRNIRRLCGGSSGYCQPSAAARGGEHTSACDHGASCAVACIKLRGSNAPAFKVTCPA
jgi:hypothetical protein